MYPIPSFNLPIWSVTDLTFYIRQMIENDDLLQDIWVQGEISNFSRPSSGHLYFTLKDSTSSLRCVMWRNTAQNLNFAPRNGQAVEVHGSINVYEAAGQYQLYADQIRPMGEGILYQEFIRLKNRLEEQGLFAAERKRPIPQIPKRIGIVTSPTAAALRDILNILKRRFPLAEVILSPTPVQGDDAPPKIVAAIQSLDQVFHPDVILLARGGGSIEDLWAFNDERVALAIASCQTPIVCGVGHETDFTIADFVSDLRAPTPTAAAELATPNKEDFILNLTEISQKIHKVIQERINHNRWVIEQQNKRLMFCSPQNRIRTDRQRLDEFARQLTMAYEHGLQLCRTRLLGLSGNLASLNPKSVLERGFAALTFPDGQQVKRAHQIHHRDSLNVFMIDGHFGVSVETPPKNNHNE